LLQRWVLWALEPPPTLAAASLVYPCCWPGGTAGRRLKCIRTKGKQIKIIFESKLDSGVEKKELSKIRK
jgi:hypothetical protein